MISGEVLKEYSAARENAFGYFGTTRGLIEVSGGEAPTFLNGLVTNDIAKLEDRKWMLAAFPNAQGRLLGFVRVARTDENFLFITDAETHEKVLQVLQRFTLAGDFRVEDLSGNVSIFELQGNDLSRISFSLPKTEDEFLEFEFDGAKAFACRDLARVRNGFLIAVAREKSQTLEIELTRCGGVFLSEATREFLRIENGVPRYGVDVDETTVVLETGLDEAVSFTKGCYIGQEIIARIHFRGHVAKKLTGLVLSDTATENNFHPGAELKSAEGKNAGRITSIAFSPRLRKFIALGFVRYDFLTEGNGLRLDENVVMVTSLPFIL